MSDLQVSVNGLQLRSITPSVGFLNFTVSFVATNHTVTGIRFGVAGGSGTIGIGAVSVCGVCVRVANAGFDADVVPSVGFICKSHALAHLSC